MQHIIRECIGAIFVILFLLRIRKKRKNKKQVLFSVLALSVVLCLVFFLLKISFYAFALPKVHLRTFQIKARLPALSNPIIQR